MTLTQCQCVVSLATGSAAGAPRASRAVKDAIKSAGDSIRQAVIDLANKGDIFDAAFLAGVRLAAISAFTHDDGHWTKRGAELAVACVVDVAVGDLRLRPQTSSLLDLNLWKVSQSTGTEQYNKLIERTGGTLADRLILTARHDDAKRHLDVGARYHNGKAGAHDKVYMHSRAMQM